MVRPRVCVVLSAPSWVVEKLPTAVVVRPPSCVAVSALAWVVVKAWISVEVSVPICAVVSAATWVEVSVRRPAVVVRLPIAVVLRPATCAVENSSRSSAFRLPATAR